MMWWIAISFLMALCLFVCGAFLIAEVYSRRSAEKPKMRAVPRQIGPNDSVTVVHQGTITPTDALEFEADVKLWREGKKVLYVPDGSHIELTRHRP